MFFNSEAKWTYQNGFQDILIMDIAEIGIMNNTSKEAYRLEDFIGFGINVIGTDLEEGCRSFYDYRGIKEVAGVRDNHHLIISFLVNEVTPKEYNAKNINEFEANFKESKGPLEGLINKLRAKRNEIDEHRKMLRIDHVRSVFESKCELAGLDKDTFKDKYESFSKVGDFMDKKMKLKKATEEEIDAMVLAEYDRLGEYKSNIGMIEEQALDYELPAEPYTRALQNDTPLVEILKQMKKDRDAAIERKQQAEAKAKAEAARLAEIEAMAQQSANEEIKAVNAETGEVIEDTKPVEGVPSKPAEPYKVNLALTFHGGENQWHQFAKLLDDNFVNYEILGENQ